jgi:hypothetical protein
MSYISCIFNANFINILQFFLKKNLFVRTFIHSKEITLKIKNRKQIKATLNILQFPIHLLTPLRCLIF